jgi:hypothetical protein
MIFTPQVIMMIFFIIISFALFCYNSYRLSQTYCCDDTQFRSERLFSCILIEILTLVIIGIGGYNIYKSRRETEVYQELQNHNMNHFEDL